MGCLTSSSTDEKKASTPDRFDSLFRPSVRLPSLYYLRENSFSLVEFSPLTGLANAIALENSPYFAKHYGTFPAYFRVANMKLALYVCGGILADGQRYSDKTFQIVTAVQAYTVTERANLAEHKADMGLAVIDETRFVIVGGHNREKVLGTVELYDADNNVWYQRGRLNVPRYSAAVCAFAERFVYVCGGCELVDQAERCVNVVERCDNTKVRPVWQLIPVYHNEWKGTVDSACFQVSTNEILICGGVVDEAGTEDIPLKSDATDEVYVFNTMVGTIKKGAPALLRKDVFISGFYYTTDETVWGCGISGTAHCYNTRKKRWTVFPLETVREKREIADAQTAIPVEAVAGSIKV